MTGIFAFKVVAKRFLIGSITAAAVTFGPLFSAAAQVVTINGAGATFPQPLYQRWFTRYSLTHRNLRFDYQAVGSGAGVRQFVAGAVDFGASDRAMTDEEIQRVRSGVLLVPTVGGGVVLTYNLPGVGRPLRFARDAYTGIFTGQVRRWNDPKIAATNPGVTLPNQPIQVVVRADGSGTSFIFSNHLAAVSPEFRTRIGASQAPKWVGSVLRGEGNPGVAEMVGRTPYSIGYVENSFAVRNRLPVARLQNRAGQYPVPSFGAFTAGLSGAELPANFRVFVSDPGGRNAYPIVGYTWILAYRQYADPAKAKAVKEFLLWALSGGQVIAPELQYVPLPDAVRQRVYQAVQSEIRAGG